MSNVLDLLDQTIFDVSRATGRPSLLQCVWVYNRAVDIDGLRRFHEHLQRGRLSRRIARSPLPFGRHRWVAPDHLPDLEIVESARPREEFDAWLTEQSKTPLDCEHGPGWHLAVLPFTDGGAGVSFVISHCLTDGVGLCEALADAAHGRDDPISWPPAASRGRLRALREDAGQAARDIPAMGRALVAAIRLARRSGGGAGAATQPPATPSAPPAGIDEPITLPTATVFVDAEEWEGRAQELGGSSTALLAGFTARLAQRVGRVAADGSVVVMMPVNERAAGDTRANAISNVGVTVDPARATIDLREIRTAIKQAWIRHRRVPDEERAVNAIVPLLPKRLLGGASGAMVGFAPNVVGSSNLGVVSPAADRPDGTDADYFAMRNVPLGVTKATMHRRGGTQLVVLGRSHGHVFVSALAYQPGRPNSDDDLRQDLSSTLNDFSLTGTHL
ncbi:hypothetical protein H5U98_27350 [Mycolicibacterium boenickei]|uniref:Diacylglycerol O-acyltransferase n=1 Tax=Mycolicibacterium boenickei TaxID=146017 RepID=A0AAX2ZWP0_9MYCO|nr:hypothetical protein [Mycolicibacterium boenickei]PEG56725.1 hypothetical protein CQY21_31150 [Mycolicibacterium boenickei]UNB99155.1 hypothetical protein H5U98_27350 [Mycolicibacterium boenickei]BBX88755.1 hypothetical protein MBOE_04040 [Mycolicibacterium boenickei]